MTKKITKLSDIEDDPQNANKGTERGQKMLHSSLQEVGAGRSIVVEAKGRTMGGAKTLKNWKKLAKDNDIILVESDGSKLVVVQRTDLDYDDPETGRIARRYAYWDNRTTEVDLEWDEHQVLHDIGAGVDLEGIFTTLEIEHMLEALEEAGEPEDFDELPEELPGMQALKVHKDFESEEPYNIPPLLPEMLTALPENVEVWAGPDASDAEREGWWLYCYGSDSVRGLDFGRTIMAFYVDDYRFDAWYEEPDRYMAKALNAGIPIMVSPNFSLWFGAPKALHIYNTFKSRWLGRYMQECGVHLIPDINFADMGSFDFCLAGIPKRPPCISIQVQTVATQAEMARQRAGVERIISELKPEQLLLYGGGEKVRESLMRILPEMPIVWLESRSQVRSNQIMSKSIEERG